MRFPPTIYVLLAALVPMHSAYRYYDEMSYEEIAEATGSSPSSAKMNFHIAKEKIIKYMNSNEKSYE